MSRARKMANSITSKQDESERDLKVGQPELPPWAKNIRKGMVVEYFWNEEYEWCEGTVIEDPVQIADELILTLHFEDDDNNTNHCDDAQGHGNNSQQQQQQTRGGNVVCRVDADSPLEGSVFPGDEIVQVNGIDTRTLSARQITALLLRLANQPRRLIVQRFT